MMLVSALLAVSAIADTVPQIVYHRPGGTPAQMEQDLRRCRLATTGPATGGERPDGAARLDNGALAVVPLDTIEGCMQAYGWRIHGLSKRAGSGVYPSGSRRHRRALTSSWGGGCGRCC